MRSHKLHNEVSWFIQRGGVNFNSRTKTAWNLIPSLENSKLQNLPNTSNRILLLGIHFKVSRKVVAAACFLYCLCADSI